MVWPLRIAKMFKIIVSYTLFLTILDTNYASSASIDRILANLEEAFNLKGLYYRSDLLLNEYSKSEPSTLWSMFGTENIDKGYIAGSSADQKKLHFLKADFEAYSQKCYVKDSRIETCTIEWFQKVVGDKERFELLLDSFLKEVQELSQCQTIKLEKPSPISVQVHCKDKRGTLALELKYRQGQSKQARFRIKLVPANRL